MTGPVGVWDPNPHQPSGYVPPHPPWQAQPQLPLPRRPRYRESGLVRWWAVLVGVGVSIVYFVLVGLVSWSPGSLVGLFLIAIALACGAAAVLLLKGDRGMGVGVAAVTGAALAVTMVVLAWGVFNMSQLLN